MRCSILAVALMLVAGLARGDERSDAIERYIVRCRQDWQSQRNIADGIAKEIAVTSKAPINRKADDENKLHNGKMAFSTKERKASRIAALEKRLSQMPLLPCLADFDYRKKPVVGDIGTPPNGYVFTTQIISPQSALVKIGFDIPRITNGRIAGGYDRQHYPLFLVGLDTNKWSDNQRVDHEEPLYVSGTYQYTTVGGAVATVPKCEPLTATELLRIREAINKHTDSTLKAKPKP